MMEEDPIIIRMNIAHFEAMLRHVMDNEKRSVINMLLAEAQQDLVLVTGLKNSDSAPEIGTRKPARSSGSSGQPETGWSTRSGPGRGSPQAAGGALWARQGIRQRSEPCR
jgi:hypothetical protein